MQKNRHSFVESNDNANKEGSKGNFLFPFKILNTFYNKGIVYKGRGDYVKSDKSNT